MIDLHITFLTGRPDNEIGEEHTALTGRGLLLIDPTKPGHLVGVWLYYTKDLGGGKRIDVNRTISVQDLISVTVDPQMVRRN